MFTIDNLNYGLNLGSYQNKGNLYEDKYLYEDNNEHRRSVHWVKNYIRVKM